MKQEISSNKKKKKQETKYVCFCTDNNGVQDMGVCIESLFYNNKFPIEVFVLHAESIKEKDKVLSIGKKYYQKITFIKIDPRPVRGLPLNGWPEATYYRLLTPDYLPKYCKKILYLDIDMVVTKDIRKLLDLNLGKYSIAVTGGKDKNMVTHEDFLGIPHGTYFGATVLLINLEKVRRKSLFRKVIEFGIDNPDKFYSVDQDLLNIFFHSDHATIPKYYNSFLLNGYTSSSNEKDTRIIHFSGKIKPYYYACPHPLRKYYLQYIRQTPWKDNFERFSFRGFFLRYGLKIMRVIKNGRIGRFFSNFMGKMGLNSFYERKIKPSYLKFLTKRKGKPNRINCTRVYKTLLIT